MNILLSSLKDLFKPRDDDALSVDLAKVQQTNVPSRPRPQGSMPSTRSSEVTASSKSAVLSRKVNPKNGTKAFLDQHDHLQQDPIEVTRVHILFCLRLALQGPGCDSNCDDCLLKWVFSMLGFRR